MPCYDQTTKEITGDDAAGLEVSNIRVVRVLNKLGIGDGDIDED